MKGFNEKPTTLQKRGLINRDGSDGIGKRERIGRNGAVHLGMWHSVSRRLRAIRHYFKVWRKWHQMACAHNHHHFALARRE